MSDSPRPAAAPPAAQRPSRDVALAVPTAGPDFTDDQKETFRSLSASMSFVGACLVLFGGLFAMFAAVAVYAGFPWGGLALLVVALGYGPTGWWITSGGRSLSGIVRTRGGDVRHLMDAVLQLQRLFAFARAIIILQTLLMTAAAGAVAWCSVADKGGNCFNVF
jgi:hypothetical protein